MNKIFLTSSLDLYYKDQNENKVPKNFGNFNEIYDQLKSSIKKYNNFLFVTSNEHNYAATDIYANVTFESFNLTLPFDNYFILDGRTEDNAKELVETADLIFLCGGHLPHQNDFFNKINLKKLLKNSKGVILAGSAGSMNCANIVYCPLELEGESIDLNFKRSLPGLSLTNINILPHYDIFKEFILDNKRYIEDIIIPDSYLRKIYALNDGSYIIIDNDKINLYGEAYIIENGIITKINENNRVINLQSK